MSLDMRPPINRAMRTLDRSFFKKTIPISAARVFQNNQLSKLRNELSKSGDILGIERISSIRPDPEPSKKASGNKCILLRPDLKHNDNSTWGNTMSQLVNTEQISLIPYDLQIDYDHWTYREIMNAILPEDALDGLTAAFQQVGHVGHMNLPDEYLPYKQMIATVLQDKNPTITTIINKVDDVGQASVYRTFSYEVLSGPDDMNVTVKEQDCIFLFNYAKVYWNSRLNTEHERHVNLFKEGDAICDVMGGIGPFAIPAGKKKCFVWANDLNPESYAALKDGIARNKVADFVLPFNEDGHKFIRRATAELYKTDREVVLRKKQSRSKPQPFQETRMTQPKTFSHFLMNLPATALTFLPSFVGLYSGANISKGTPLPKIHVYCFNTKSDDNKAEGEKICEEISQHLNFSFKPGDGSKEGEVEVIDVRDVAPKKRMFCASFILPEEVAHRVVE
ncbi:hypothetical protein BT63DRAFT_29083 [Microthyrium microscopicum]|uniref:tRNA (guanine(37)-N1)-methyltransferase n=1 Tax=Microthyrium microscopicum TaxID=703497 RepID=A0A6A6UUH5_9PEZI|nr:hypothetical protein BT63DRAFT_29083 [Microthyrium microscopicum]